MSPTVTAIHAWLDEVLAFKSPRTREGYKDIVMRFWRFLEATHRETRLELLKPQDVRAFFASFKGKSHNSLVSYDKTLRAVFNRIEREGILDFGLPDDWRSPFRQIARLNSKRSSRQPLTPELSETLLKVQPRRGFVHARNYAMLSLLILTGLRASEVQDIKLNQVDLVNRTLSIRGKGDKHRIVFLPKRAVRVLLAYLSQRGDRGDLLFPTRDGLPLGRRGVHRAVACAGRRAGIERLHPHLLRHTHISIALNVRGAPIKYVQEQVGHSDIETTMGYTHTFPDKGAQMADQYSVLD